MLKTVTDDGHLEWECHNGCPTLTAHISHEHVEWTDSGVVGLSPCPQCGSRHFLKMDFTEQELIEPIIERGTHPFTGQEIITSVDLQGGPPNFTMITEHVEKRMIVDENQVKRLVAAGFPEAAARVLAPPIPVYTRVIDSVDRHPALALHQKLAGQLKAIGKTPS